MCFNAACSQKLCNLTICKNTAMLRFVPRFTKCAANLYHSLGYLAFVQPCCRNLCFYLPWARALISMTDAFVRWQVGSCWRNDTPKSSQILTQSLWSYLGELKVVHESVDVTGANFTGKKQISVCWQRLWLVYWLLEYFQYFPPFPPLKKKIKISGNNFKACSNYAFKLWIKAEAKTAKPLQDHAA